MVFPRRALPVHHLLVIIGAVFPTPPLREVRVCKPLCRRVGLFPAIEEYRGHPVPLLICGPRGLRLGSQGTKLLLKPQRRLTQHGVESGLICTGAETGSEDEGVVITS